jgi:hypothetical protein
MCLCCIACIPFVGSMSGWLYLELTMACTGLLLILAADMNIKI